jgi:hypothetical protein
VPGPDGRFEDLKLYDLQLGNEHLQALASLCRNPRVGLIVDDGEQPIDAGSPDWRDNLKLRHVCANGVRQHDQLSVEQ